MNRNNQNNNYIIVKQKKIKIENVSTFSVKMFCKQFVVFSKASYLGESIHQNETSVCVCVFTAEILKIGHLISFYVVKFHWKNIYSYFFPEIYLYLFKKFSFYKIFHISEHANTIFSPTWQHQVYNRSQHNVY